MNTINNNKKMKAHNKEKLIAEQFKSMFYMFFNCLCDKNIRILFFSMNGFIPSFWKKINRFGHMNLSHDSLENSNEIGFIE